MSKSPNNHSSKPVVRCAIYTRKSTEEGLDQDFNSLDAQRESGEAYIASQKSAGWNCLPEAYDDGGFTGGNMERPALRRLMADIQAGKVDVVVVYKVDRLSRSLLDFARIMETFDKKNVAFVSVTQQFNTSTPMGRLVLNVLLSFAQFEREIIGERIRDKIAAQRRRGLWSGSHPVLGYDVDRSNRTPKLVVNAEEAARVRAIFNLYLKLGSMLNVIEELQRRSWVNKQWRTRKGCDKGGRSFDANSLHYLLTNPIYIGKIKHRSLLHAGEHEAIVPAELFQKVQRQLQHNRRTGGAKLRNRYGALLRGLLVCKGCQRTMVHTFTNKGPKRYRYYTCTHAIQGGRKSCDSGSLPAVEIERVVVDQIRCIVQDDALRDEVFRQAQAQVAGDLNEFRTQEKELQKELAWRHGEIRKLASHVQGDAEVTSLLANLHDEVARVETRIADVRAKIEDAASSQVTHADMTAALSEFDNVWGALSPREQAAMLAHLVSRVEFDVEAGTVAVSFHNAGIKALAQGQSEEAA